ncbi:MAG TPA: ABC transporter permease [Candidatus Dormibacteraeota bacterium]|nr:ABC transporter permease [Candidatus Dormibacteraeota bacterium]
MADLVAGAPAVRAPRPVLLTRLRGAAAAWGPALPLLALIAFCLIAPIVVLVFQSFVPAGSFTLDLWVRVLGEPVNQDAIVTSLLLGVASATVTLIVGAPAAWLISRMLAGRRAFWLGLLNVAANFGGIGLAFAYLATLGAVGMLTLIVQALGFDFSPPRSSSFPALLMAYEYTNIPLFVLLTIPAMGVLRDDWWEAAQTAAATRWQFWRMIGLPILTPFLAGGWLLIFTWSIGIYGIAYGLAGQSGGTAVRLITLQIGNALQSDVLTGSGKAAVLSVVLLTVAAASLLTYRALLRRALRWF